jgi:hypothetical protein
MLLERFHELLPEKGVSYTTSTNGGLPLTSEDFRRMALDFPETAEGAHMGHPDFRVRGKIFATLWPNEGWGMVKLTPEQQRILVQA